MSIARGKPAPPTQASKTPTEPDLKVANASNPGERLELSSCLVAGKPTLIEFYSEDCPPCREMEPVLERIAASKPEMAIRRLDIDRRGSAGIDWDSPLAEQYGLETVPAFRVYTATGALESE